MASPPDPVPVASDEQPLPLYETEASRAYARKVVLLVAGILFYQGYASAIVPIASPWIAKSFGLDQSALAAVFAWMTLAYLGAIALARMVDRFGRRRVMVWSMLAMPVSVLGAAVSTHLATFI